jgi:hypothetical protein
VPLKKDHSNLGEVLAVLHDPVRAQQIIDRAYGEVALNPVNRYQDFVQMFDKALAGAFDPGMRSRLAPPNDREFAEMTAPSPQMRRRRQMRRLFISAHNVLFSRLLGWASPEARDLVELRLKNMLRPVQLVWRHLYHRQ